MKFSLYVLLLLMVCGCQVNNLNQASAKLSLTNHVVMPLYPNNVPGEIDTKDLEYVRDPTHPDTFIMAINRPTLHVFLPPAELANGTAVIILPGGGYAGVSIVKEGYEVAQRLNKLGVSAFVLKYRMPLSQSMQNKSIGPLQDAQQAIALVRQHSSEWHIDSTKVGIMGFSAGGHLAASAAVHFTQAVNSELAKQNLRPDFQILIYPVISFAAEITHAGSRDNLIGPNLNPEQVRFFSNELQVNDATPPAFIVHAGDDSAVPVANSLVYYQALQQHKIATQMLLLPTGGHGFGMRNQYDWFTDLVGWMDNRHLLAK